jgi:hypothetical protein
MLSLRLRRAIAIFALTAATVILPLSDLSAAPRSESRWNGLERTPRGLSQTLSFWNVLVSLWEKTGLRIDNNGHD